VWPEWVAPEKPKKKAEEPAKNPPRRPYKKPAKASNEDDMPIGILVGTKTAEEMPPITWEGTS
jgi:hypothetical protein